MDVSVPFDVFEPEIACVVALFFWLRRRRTLSALSGPPRPVYEHFFFDLDAMDDETCVYLFR